MSGLELCPKCKRGHLYPMVTSSAEPTGRIRYYECAICGYKQKGTKQTQKVDAKNEESTIVNKNKNQKQRPKTKAKSKAKKRAKLG